MRIWNTELLVIGSRLHSTKTGVLLIRFLLSYFILAEQGVPVDSNLNVSNDVGCTFGFVEDKEIPSLTILKGEL